MKHPFEQWNTMQMLKIMLLKTHLMELRIKVFMMKCVSVHCWADVFQSLHSSGPWKVVPTAHASQGLIQIYRRRWTINKIGN